jgi:polysaccharide pyruvyl transferase WcaK-like protein
MMFFIAYLAKKHFNKPVALISHTADLEHTNLKEIAKHIYPLLDDTVFRDELSLEACKDFSKGRVAADVTFAYKPAPAETWQILARRAGFYDHGFEQNSSFDASQPFICIGGSSMFSPRHQRAYKPQEALKALCLRLQTLSQVVLTASAKPDELLFKPLAQDLQVPFIPLATSPTQAVDLLGNASLYIGGRWHGGIFALTGGTPVVSFAAETFKQHALMQQFGLHEPFDALKLEQHVDELVELSKDYLAQGESLRQRLKCQARALAKTVPEHVRLLRELSKW